MAKIEDIFHVMTFGKHKGKTVGEVFEADPGYLIWAHSEVSHFNLTPALLEQAKQELIRRKDAEKQAKIDKIKKAGLLPSTYVNVSALSSEVKKTVAEEIKSLKEILKNLDDDVPF